MPIQFNHDNFKSILTSSSVRLLLAHVGTFMRWNSALWPWSHSSAIRFLSVRRALRSSNDEYVTGSMIRCLSCSLIVSRGTLLGDRTEYDHFDFTTKRHAFWRIEGEFGKC